MYRSELTKFQYFSLCELETADCQLVFYLLCVTVPLWLILLYI